MAGGGECVCACGRRGFRTFPDAACHWFFDGRGVELLIHIGLDTVQLNGEGFQARVAQGDRVKKGQLLVSFDMAFIEEKDIAWKRPCW